MGLYNVISRLSDGNAPYEKTWTYYYEKNIHYIVLDYLLFSKALY